jgi:hypothetical protein
MGARKGNGLNRGIPRGDEANSMNDTDHNYETERIRAQIDRTRAEMDETVDALEARLKPKHLLDEALERLLGDDHPSSEDAKQSLRRAGSTVAAKIKENPLPALLVGAGVAWLFLGNDDDEKERAYRRRFSRHRDAYDDELDPFGGL